MGKQVNFILLPEDLKALEEAIGRIGPFVVLHSCSKSEKVRPLVALDPDKSGEDWLHLFLVRPEDVDLVVTQPVAAQGYWSIDALRSPVVEFQRCFYDGQTLRRGRAYFVEQYYDANKKLVQKPATFRVWGQTVLNTIRRTLQRQGADYTGTQAQRWLSSGAGVLLD